MTENNKTKNYTWANRNQRLHNIYKAMIHRCYNCNDKDYKYYGARGVRVCDIWLNDARAFETWALSNSYADDYSIDRINPYADYSPENCRWIPFVENSRRAGKVNWIEIDGQVKTGRQWSEFFGLGINYVNKQIKKYGLDVTTMLLTSMYYDENVFSQIERVHKHKNLSLIELYNIRA